MIYLIQVRTGIDVKEVGFLGSEEECDEFAQKYLQSPQQEIDEGHKDIDGEYGETIVYKRKGAKLFIDQQRVYATPCIPSTVEDLMRHAPY